MPGVPQSMAEPALEPALSESVPSALSTRPLLLFLLGSPNQGPGKGRGCENMNPRPCAMCKRWVNEVPYFPGMLYLLFWRI